MQNKPLPPLPIHINLFPGLIGLTTLLLTTIVFVGHRFIPDWELTPWATLPLVIGAGLILASGIMLGQRRGKTDRHNLWSLNHTLNKRLHASGMPEIDLLAHLDAMRDGHEKAVLKRIEAGEWNVGGEDGLNELLKKHVELTGSI